MNYLKVKKLIFLTNFMLESKISIQWIMEKKNRVIKKTSNIISKDQYHWSGNEKNYLKVVHLLNCEQCFVSIDVFTRVINPSKSKKSDTVELEKL